LNVAPIVSADARARSNESSPSMSSIVLTTCPNVSRTRNLHAGGPSRFLLRAIRSEGTLPTARRTIVKSSIPKSWKQEVGGELTKSYFKDLEAFVSRERAQFPDRIYPPEKDVFSAFQLTPFENVDVLLLGQDPYFHAGQAHGLCFSVRKEVKPPPSLHNIFKELNSDVGCAIPDNGFLVPWAEQGVLMLNTVLTVREGKPASHAGHGWETFTDFVISRVSAKPTTVVFVLWGDFAKKKKKLIDTARHIIVEGKHPSPLSANHGFFGSKPFSAINRALQAAGRAAIDWQIPNLFGKGPSPTKRAAAALPTR
jgi:uracil-DNA glycosylase